MTIPLFAPNADGTAFDIQPAGVLLLLADMLYGPQDDPAWTGRSKTEAMLLAMLKAARAGGYMQADILHTLLVRNERTKRVQEMAVGACSAAGNERIAALYKSMGYGEK